MRTRDEILRLLKRKKSLRARELLETLNISSQTLSRHLHRLAEQGLLIKTGSTRDAAYHLPKSGERNIQENELHLVKNIPGLQEDLVFSEVQTRLALSKALSKNVAQIAAYAFSEMLNNAIEHAKSDVVHIQVAVKGGRFEFTIRDHGIGAFANVQKQFHLQDEYEAAFHLFKGKQTTDPKHHSGEGIFFTSRIADRFELRSHRILATVDNEKDDVHFADARNLPGTQVKFSIKRQSRKSLQALFDEFSGKDFEFSKNEIRIRLNSPIPLVSRSQARRLLAGLEKFKSITFDFHGASGIGQAFADEIFRVFPAQNPNISLDYVRATPAIEFMIKRARAA